MYLKKLVGLFDETDVEAHPDVASCSTSYVIKANFKPSEVSAFTHECILKFPVSR